MIDPQIPLQTQGVNIPPFVQQLAAMKTANLNNQVQQGVIKAQGQESQIHDQVLQQGQIDLQLHQQTQQDIADTRAATVAAVDPNTGQVDRLKYLSTLGKLNPAVAAQAAQGLKTQDVAMQEAQAKSQEAQLTAAKQHLAFKDQILQGANAGTWANTRALALQSGFNPQEIPEQYPGDAWVAQAHQQTLSQQQIIAQHEKDAETGEKNRHDKALETQAANTLQSTQAHQLVEEHQGAQRIGIEGARLNMEKAKSNFDQNASVEAMAQQVASGDVKKPTVTRQNPFNQAVLQRAYEINPQLNDSLYTMTQDARSTKPNSMGANVTRLGTAILHGDRALQNSGNLGFSEGLLTGIPTEGTAAYKQDAEFLTGEVGQFVTGGKLTVDEGKKISSDLMSSRQGVRDSALKQVIDLAGGKLKAQMEQYKNATQNNFPTDRVYNDPDIKSALERHGVLGGSQSPGGMIRAVDPNGQLHEAPAGTPLPQGWKLQ